MFCRKCGCQLDDGAKFCPSCGEAVNQGQGSKSVGDGAVNRENTQQQNAESINNPYTGFAGDSMNEEKFDLKAFLTMENIERFAPLATFIPLVMGVICFILYALSNVLGWFSVFRTVFWVVKILVKALFVFATAGATGGLVYIIIKTKNTSDINTWVTPFGTLLATIACLGFTLGWTVPAWLLGLVSALLGLEFLARVVIAGMPIETPMNPGVAINSYKQFYADYKAKYPTTKDLEKAGIADPEKSKFDGSGLELLGYKLLTVLVSLLTCGIATPWMICKICRWRIGHTVINGKRLTFTGNGASLLGHWILWEILSVCTCGIYTFFAHVALRRWELSHTYIEGEPIYANEKESYFDGDGFAYLGYGLLKNLLLLVTCGLSYPWVMVMLQKWDTKHQVINRRRLVFSGSGLGFLGEYLIIFILSVITCGLYSPWGTVRLNKYIIRNTDFVN